MVYTRLAIFAAILMRKSSAQQAVAREGRSDIETKRENCRYESVVRMTHKEKAVDLWITGAEPWISPWRDIAIFSSPPTYPPPCCKAGYPQAPQLRLLKRNEKE